MDDWDSQNYTVKENWDDEDEQDDLKDNWDDEEEVAEGSLILLSNFLRIFLLLCPSM